MEELICIAKRHFCQAFIWKALKMCDAQIPDNLDKLVKLFIFRNLNNLSVQNKVVKVLRENNIKCAVLKGSSVASFYKEPLLRLLGDIDILVSEEDFDKTVDIFLQGQEKNEKSAKHEFHYALRFEGFSVEIHKHIIESEDENALSAGIVGNWIKDAQTGRLDEFEFPVLKTEHQAVSLLLHMKRHMKENNINFRLLLDWLVFSDSISTDVWNGKVYPQLKELKLHKLADALLCLSDKYFKTDNADKIHNNFSDEVVDMLISDFLLSGAGNSTDKSSGFVAAVYAESNKKSSILKMVDALNARSYKWFKISRYKMLLPVCWLILAVRYVFGVVTGRREKITLSGVKQSAKRKERLHKELDLKN
ncbi:MAG: nucleotidyltransferase family protein [Clostridia bacterium]|nr:nucleotidyltransferase family protein [Clostridia bacterium]